VDQRWLSKTAEECGFGRIVHISRVTQEGPLASGEGKGRRVDGYPTKCLRHTSKELSSQSDWPNGTRRWGASRAARAQMKRPERNPDWFFLLEEPKGFLPCDVSRYRSLTPDELPARGFSESARIGSRVAAAHGRMPVCRVAEGRRLITRSKSC
jgi:hypothetical protein